MAWDGSGNFVRLHGSTGWTDDKNSAINILSSRHDDHDNDIAGGIGLAMTKDNQSKPAADFKPNLDNSYDIGSLALGWKNIYARAMRVMNGAFYTSLTATTLSANRTVTFPDANAFIRWQITKAADTSRASSPTPSNDPDLVAVLPTAGTYRFRAFINFYGNTSTTNGIAIGINYSGSFTSPPSVQCISSGNVNSTAVISITTGIFNVPNAEVGTQTFATIKAANPSDWVELSGYVIATTTGTLGVTWSQASSNVTATTVRAGSHLIVERVL